MHLLCLLGGSSRDEWDSERCVKEQMGARANLAHMLLQACLKLIRNLHAECKIYQHHVAVIIKTCVPNSRPTLSPSSSKQAKNERERPKLLPLGPAYVISVNVFSLRNLALTERFTCKTIRWGPP